MDSLREKVEGSDGIERTPCSACGSADESGLSGPAGVDDLLLCDDCIDAGVDWWRKGFNNVAEWGMQDLETLLLATQEELGELTQAFLEARAEGGDPERIQEELDDLAPLMFQMQLAINRRGVSND